VDKEIEKAILCVIRGRKDTGPTSTPVAALLFALSDSLLESRIANM
jgi:hypothetical protein